MTLSLSGIDLSALANQVSLVTQAFEAQPSQGVLRPLRESLDAFLGLAPRGTRSLLNLRSDHDARTKRQSLLEELNRLEGCLRGLMAKNDLLPSEPYLALQQRIDDPTASPERIVEGTKDAHRHIRRGFISAFLDAAEIEPIRGRRYLKHTPLRLYAALQSRWSHQSFVKPENDQEGESYAIRGVLFFLMQHLQSGLRPEKHSLFCAPRPALMEGFVHAAHLLGFEDITIFLPQHPHATTLTSIRRLGAKPRTLRVSPEEIEAAAQEAFSSNRQSLFVPNRHPLMAMGYATLGVEIALSPSLASALGYSVIVPSRDASLLTGLSHFFRPRGTATFSLEEQESDALPLGSVHIHRGEPVVVVFPDRRVEEREIASKILSRA